MKKIHYIYAAAMLLLGIAACKKEEPAAELPAGVTDAEYIDGVLSDAVAMVNPADLNPAFDFYDKIILPIQSTESIDMKGVNNLIADFYEDMAKDDVTEVNFDRFAGEVIITVNDKVQAASFVPAEEEGARTLTVKAVCYEETAEAALNWGAETFPISGKIDKNNMLAMAAHLRNPEAPVADKPEDMKEITFRVPASVTASLKYKDKGIADVSAAFRVPGVTVGEDGVPADFKAFADIAIKVCGLSIQAANASLAATAGVPSIQAPLTLSSRKGTIGQFTVNASGTGPTSGLSNISVSGNILERLALDVHVDDEKLKAATTPDERNAAQIIDLFYRSTPLSHDKRNASIVLDAEYNMVPAFRTNNFTPESKDYISPANFPKTYSAGSAIFMWVMMRIQGGKTIEP